VTRNVTKSKVPHRSVGCSMAFTMIWKVVEMVKMTTSILSLRVRGVVSPSLPQRRAMLGATLGSIGTEILWQQYE
jgi:hypothetical protein